MKYDAIRSALRSAQALTKKYAPVLAIGLIGVLILLWPKKQAVQPDTKSSEQPAQQSLAQTEQRLAALLSHIDGAGEVQVMLSLRTGAQTVYQTDTRRVSDAAGETQEVSTVLCPQSSSAKAPLIRQTEYPIYRGAVVVCTGAERASVQLAIVEAVSSLTGLGSDHITVVKMKEQ